MIALSASGEAAWQSLRQHVEWTPGFWLAWIFTNHTPSGRELFDRVAAQMGGLGRSAAVRRPGAPADLTDLLVWLFSGADAIDGCVAIEIVQDSDEWKGAYRDFLLRLNERRERLRRTLHCGLVVIVPARFKSTTSADAPDLWSIRSLSLDVAPPTATRYATGDFDVITTIEGPEDASPHELRLADQAVTAAQRSNSRESEAMARLRRARALFAEGQALEARAEASRVVEMAPSSELIVEALETLGMIDTKLGDRVAAERHYLAAIELGQELVSEEALLALANLLEGRGATEEALSYARAALHRHQVRQESPTVEALRSEYAAQTKVGDILRSRGAPAAALVHYSESLALARRIRAMHGDTPEALRGEYLALIRVGDVSRAQGDISTALTNYQKGLDLVRRVRAAIGDAPEILRSEAGCLEEISSLLLVHGRENAAWDSVEASLELYRRRQAMIGDTTVTLHDLARALSLKGLILHHQRRFKNARHTLGESLEMRRRIRTITGDTPESLRGEASTLGHLGDILESMGDTAAALVTYRLGLELCRQIRTLTGDTKDSLGREARMLSGVARVDPAFASARDVQHFGPGEAGMSLTNDGSEVDD